MGAPRIPTLPGAEVDIPKEVSRIYDLAYNLWWTWSPRAHLLFSSVDPAAWLRTHNPVEVLQTIEPHLWETLLASESFMAEYHAVVDEFDRYMKGESTAWFPRTFPDRNGEPVAYLSTEFGWHECLGVYSGGLGVLSGDHCKSASDLGVPFVGIGLMYRRGYFQQTIDSDGRQQHFYPDYDLRRLPVLPVAGPGNKQLRVSVELPGRDLWLRVWKVQVGRVQILLLDSDLRENDPADRPITSVLYVRGREMRFFQELALGIGGFRALKALGITPSVWHLNEGHSALVNLERAREVMRDDVGLEAALERIRENSVFTTHTPVPAGNETFDVELVRNQLAGWGRSVPDLERFVRLGLAKPGENDPVFNMTILAIRTSSRRNGVSKLHGQVADAMWSFLWPDAPAGEARIGHITNGIHTPTWIGPETGELLRRHLGTDYLDHLLDPGFLDAVLAIPDAEIWAAHQAQKNRLLLVTRDRLLAQFARHGRSPEELRRVHHIFDPDHLTLGFARRFATYKRADLLFRDPERLRSILGHAERPVQIFFAGKAHPADKPGQELIRTIFDASISKEFQGRIVFLENYDMRIARFLVQGVDVWVNTPRRPLEASGTSGMKAAANGGLNCSVYDGWWCEGYEAATGWVVGEARDYGDPEQQDREDAASLYHVLADEIAPAFYRRDASGTPVEWVGRMKRAIGKLAPRFSTQRMVREYALRAYVPASRPGAEADEAALWSP
jgi:starch phosphorylase